MDMPFWNAEWRNHPLNKGLIGYWPLRRHFAQPAGRKVLDYSGNGNDGAVVGAIPVDDPVNGRLTYFDGVDDNIKVTGNAALRPAAFTLSMLVRKDPVSEPADFSCFFASKDGATSGFAVNFNQTAPRRVYLSANDNAGGAFNTALFNTDMALGEVRFFTWTVLNKNLTAYENGVLKGTTTMTNNYLAQSTTDIYFGRASHFNGNFLRAYFGEIRFYNRVLSAAEIAQLYKISIRRL